MPERPLKPHHRRPAAINQAELNRLAHFIRITGSRIGRVEMTPSKISIVMIGAENLTGIEVGDELDKELQQHRIKRGNGAP